MDLFVKKKLIFEPHAQMIETQKSTFLTNKTFKPPAQWQNRIKIACVMHAVYLMLTGRRRIERSKWAKNSFKLNLEVNQSGAN